jgi:hypothetical protein
MANGLLLVNHGDPSNPLDTCVTMLGATTDPFNALNMQPCSGGSSQFWNLNPGDKSLCLSARSDMCMGIRVPMTSAEGLFGIGNSSGVQIVHPTVHAPFAYNPSTQALYIDGDCRSVLNIAGGFTTMGPSDDYVRK